MNRFIAMSVLSLVLGANVTIVDLAEAEERKQEPIKVTTVGKPVAPVVAVPLVAKPLTEAVVVQTNPLYTTTPPEDFIVKAAPGMGSGPEHFIDRKNRIEIPVSSAGVNRISIVGDRILKIVGNEDEYIVEGDSSKGHVFLTSKLAASEKAFATIVSEKGVIQDVVFRTHTGAPSTIVLKHKPTKLTKLEDVIATRMRNIFAGRTKSLRSKALNVQALRGLPKAKEAIEYSTATHRYIWLSCEVSYPINLLNHVRWDGRWSSIIAAGIQGNQIILVEKL